MRVNGCTERRGRERERVKYDFFRGSEEGRLEKYSLEKNIGRRLVLEICLSSPLCSRLIRLARADRPTDRLLLLLSFSVGVKEENERGILRPYGSSVTEELRRTYPFKYLARSLICIPAQICLTKCPLFHPSMPYIHLSSPNRIS